MRKTANEIQEEIGNGTVSDIKNAIKIIDRIGIVPKRYSKGQYIQDLETNQKYPMKYVVDIHYALKKSLIIKSQDDVTEVIRGTKYARAYLKDVKNIKEYFYITERNPKNI